MARARTPAIAKQHPAHSAVFCPRKSVPLIFYTARIRSYKKMQKRGQTSTEYLMIVGFSLFIITLLMVVYGQQSTDQRMDLTYSQINKIGNTLIDTAEGLYFRGEDVRKNVKIYMPSNVQNITVYNTSLVFNVKAGQGISQMDFPSNVILDGNLSPIQGVKIITVTTKPGFVCIVEEGDPECP
jgi:hypothetical protein